MNHDERSPAQERLVKILAGFDSGMLVTTTPAGVPHARPMVVVRCDADANLCFMTRLATGKIDELMQEPRVCVTFQSDREYASLTGRARVIDEPERIRSLWNEDLRPHFPRGPDDPDLAVLSVTTRYAEFWDETPRNAARYALEALSAAVSGGPRPPGERSRHARLVLHDASTS